MNKRNSLLRAAATPLALAAGALAALGTQARPVAAQSAAANGRNELFADGELERYLRVTQLTGRSPLYPWSIRGFSPKEVDRIAPSGEHPWAKRYAISRADSGVRGLQLIAPAANVVVNSGFPFGSHDGPVWAGRGATAALSAGVTYRRGVLSAALAPVIFRSQNLDVPLRANGQTGRLAYASADFPLNVDRPQRFGDGAYGRADWGESFVRLDVGPVAAGVSTATEAWGPAAEYPFLLGNNAPGFGHVFFGTAHPVSLWLVTVHGRVLYGELAQSDFAVLQGKQSRRFTSAAVGEIGIRGVPGLEIGGARFFHQLWPDSGGLTSADFRRPIENLFAGKTSNDANAGRDNQLLSLFFRWAAPVAGLEVYGEYGREDHNYDLREFLGEPDHASSKMLGVQKAWGTKSGSYTVARLEGIDFQTPAVGINRGEGAIYIHTVAQQGHTQRGQLLGADVGVGSAAGTLLAVDRYDQRGRWTVSWMRDLRSSNGALQTTGIVDKRGIDVQHAFGAQALIFAGPLDVHAGLTGVMNLNRDYVRDRFNLNATLGVRRPIR